MLDIVKLCRSRGIPFLEESGHHHAHAGWVQLHCPYCAGGRDGWHLGFNLESGFFRCWRCGSLRFWDVLARVTALADKSQLSELVSEMQKGRASIVRKEVIRKRDLKPVKGMTEMTRAHREYLRLRNYDADKLETIWKLKGTTGRSGVWNWRLMIPIYNGAGRLIAYQGRAIGEGVKPRYKLTDNDECLEEPAGIIYGIHKANEETALIVEGAMSVFRLGPGTLALLGQDWSKEQANMLRRFKNRFILFDPEPPAQRRAEKLAAHLSLFRGNTEILSGFKKQPGDLSDKTARRIRKLINL